MFYTKFHSPRPIFYSPSLKSNRIGERASVSLLTEQYGHHFANSIFTCIFLVMHFDQTVFHWNFNLFVKVQWSIKVLVWVMVWHTAGDKQLPKPMMTHIPNTYKSPGLDVLTGYGMKILYQIKKIWMACFFCNFLFAKDKMHFHHVNVG